MVSISYISGEAVEWYNLSMGSFIIKLYIIYKIFTNPFYI